MSVHFVAAGETLNVSGPAKVVLTGNDDAAPAPATKPTPTISGLAPNTAVHGAADVTVTVTGTNYSTYTRAQVDGVDVATTYISATQVSFKMPVASATGAATRVVKTRNGDKVSSGSNFTIT